MNILYIGTTLFDKNCNSYLRKKSLEKLNYNVKSIDPFELFLEENYALRYFHYNTGYHFYQKKLLNWINSKIKKIRFLPDVIWVDGGELLGGGQVSSKKLKKKKKKKHHDGNSPRAKDSSTPRSKK